MFYTLSQLTGPKFKEIEQKKKYIYMWEKQKKNLVVIFKNVMIQIKLREVRTLMF